MKGDKRVLLGIILFLASYLSVNGEEKVLKAGDRFRVTEGTPHKPFNRYFDSNLGEGPPVIIQKVQNFLLMPLARAMGYQSFYEKHHM